MDKSKVYQNGVFVAQIVNSVAGWVVNRPGGSRIKAGFKTFVDAKVWTRTVNDFDKVKRPVLKESLS